MSSTTIKDNIPVIWLICCAFLVLCMVMLGGYTRLSDAGLSIVDWRPITGIIPPLGEKAWIAEFAKYMLSPEFIKINSSITLEQFKSIYLIEYAHRVLGRLTVLGYILPFVYFIAAKRILVDKLYMTGIALLLLAQGVMGWLMVKSGLINDPHVSHFRLAAHLMLAVFAYSMMVWQILRFIRVNSSVELKHNKCSTLFGWGLLTAVYLQTFLGGLVAGLDAGLVYNEFPLMGDSIIPAEWDGEDFTYTLLYDPVIIQFFHRIGGVLICLVGIGYSISLLWLGRIRCASVITISLLLQLSLGISTLLAHVEILPALLHQLMALIIVTLILRANSCVAYL